MIYPLLLVAVAGGIVYAAYQQPQLRPYLQPHLQTLTARVPLLQRLIPATPETTELAATKTAAPKDEEPAIEIEMDSVAASETLVAINAPVITPIETPAEDSSIADNAGNIAAALAAQTAQIAALQKDILRLQSERNKTNAPDTAAHLDLIDLRLQIGGDTVAAADALLALPDNADVNAQWLTGEVARLQNTPARTQIVLTLQKLMQIIARDSTAVEIPPAAINSEEQSAEEENSSAANSFSATTAQTLKQIFNVRRAGESKSAADNGQRLRRLELLLLTGQHSAYLSALHKFAARPLYAKDANVPLLIDTLQKFGAPIYALNRSTQ